MESLPTDSPPQIKGQCTSTNGRLHKGARWGRASAHQRSWDHLPACVVRVQNRAELTSGAGAAPRNMMRRQQRQLRHQTDKRQGHVVRPGPGPTAKGCAQSGRPFKRRPALPATALTRQQPQGEKLPPPRHRTRAGEGTCPPAELGLQTKQQQQTQPTGHAHNKRRKEHAEHNKATTKRQDKTWIKCRYRIEHRLTSKLGL